MSTGLIDYNALPNIIVTRYEGNKKNGFVAVYSDGTVELLGAVKKRINTVDVVGGGGIIGAYTIDGLNGDNYDFGIYPGITYLDFINFQDGQEIKCVVRNLETAICLLVVSGQEVIKWLNNDLPTVVTNAIITFYKSNNIIYAEIRKPYVGGGGSDSSGS